MDGAPGGIVFDEEDRIPFPQGHEVTSYAGPAAGLCVDEGHDPFRAIPVRWMTGNDATKDVTEHFDP